MNHVNQNLSNVCITIFKLIAPCILFFFFFIIDMHMD